MIEYSDTPVSHRDSSCGHCPVTQHELQLERPWISWRHTFSEEACARLHRSVSLVIVCWGELGIGATDFAAALSAQLSCKFC